MRAPRTAGVLALAGLVAAYDVGFIVPPDGSNTKMPDYDLTFAFGDFMTARWWSDWKFVNMNLSLCGGNQTFNILTNAVNTNEHTFLLGADLPTACRDYRLLVQQINPDDSLGYTLESQHFLILNQTNPPVTKGTVTDLLSTTLPGGAPTTFWLTEVVTASNSPVFAGAAAAAATSATALTSAQSGASQTSSAAAAPPGGLSQAAKTGLGVGLGLGLPLLLGLAAVVGFRLTRRRPRRSEASSHDDDKHAVVAEDPPGSPVMSIEKPADSVVPPSTPSAASALDSRLSPPELENKLPPPELEARLSPPELESKTAPQELSASEPGHV